MQIVNHDDEVEGRAAEWMLTALEIADFATQRQLSFARGLVQLAYRVNIAIDGKCRQSTLREPQRVSPASAGDVECARRTWQQAGVLHEP